MDTKSRGLLNAHLPLVRGDAGAGGHSSQRRYAAEPADAVGNPRADAVVTEELVAIVVRASQLGYCPWRVGIALRVPSMELAWICTRPQPDASTAKTLMATPHVEQRPRGADG